MLPFALSSRTPGSGLAQATGPRPAVAGPAGLRGLSFAILLAIGLSAFEGPVRYALHLLHLDPLIFARDLLLFATLAVFIALRMPGRTVPLSVGVFVLLAAVHGLVSTVNVGTPIAAIYGLKMFIPALCGFLAFRAIFEPGRPLVPLIAVMWLASVIGAALEQYWVDYPWVGMNVELGGVDVFLGRDWQAGFSKRVAGFARSSINLAIVLPLLSFMLLGALRSRLAQAAVCLLTLAVLLWATQKGAILGYGLALLALALSNRNFLAPLRAAIAGATLLMVFAPTVLIHFRMPRDRGTFSFESLIERIDWMWPNAWAWIDRFPPFLGVGLGGIGGGQRFFAPQDQNAADNLFVYLYGNFGVASLAYLAAVVWLALGASTRDFRRAALVLASLCFLLMYGLVISLVEDQIAALWLGACLGWLAQDRLARPDAIPRAGARA